MSFVCWSMNSRPDISRCSSLTPVALANAYTSGSLTSRLLRFASLSCIHINLSFSSLGELDVVMPGKRMSCSISVSSSLVGLVTISRPRRGIESPQGVPR